MRTNAPVTDYLPNMELSLIIGILGFILASYSVVGNDVIQTLGTFLTSK